VITNTAWNSPSGRVAGEDGGYSPMTVAPFYDTTNSAGPMTLSNAQRDAVTDIWMRMAEDFAPFDIDVTTEVPSGCPSTCGNGGSCYTCPRNVQISLFAGSHKDVDTSSSIGGVTCPSGGCTFPGPTAGGIAYLNKWSASTKMNPYYRPAWTFNGRLNSGSSQPAGVTGSHEAGHNFGLGHDGTNVGGQSGVVGSTGYLQRVTGSSGTDWGPIMGAPFSGDVTQWSGGDVICSSRKSDAMQQLL